MGVIEFKPGLDEEPVEEAGPVLHLPEAGLHQHSQLPDVLRGEVAQGPSEVGPDELDRVELGKYGGSWKTVSHSRAAG